VREGPKLILCYCYLIQKSRNLGGGGGGVGMSQTDLVLLQFNTGSFSPQIAGACWPAQIPRGELTRDFSILGEANRYYDKTTNDKTTNDKTSNDKTSNDNTSNDITSKRHNNEATKRRNDKT